MIRIALTSVFVDDLDKAHAFYTDVLGFEVKQDFPIGESRWLTVASPAGPDGVELLLEPNGNPISLTYQKGLFEAGISAALFATDDIQADYARMVERGVVFTMPPTEMGSVTLATFNDTCGNLIGLFQPR